MELIPQWNKWWKRWSTWLLVVIGGINLNDVLGWLPSVQQYMDADVYRYSMIGLSLAVIIATNIKQKSVSGERA